MSYKQCSCHSFVCFQLDVFQNIVHFIKDFLSNHLFILQPFSVSTSNWKIFNKFPIITFKLSVQSSQPQTIRIFSMNFGHPTQKAMRYKYLLGISNANCNMKYLIQDQLHRILSTFRTSTLARYIQHEHVDRQEQAENRPL